MYDLFSTWQAFTVYFTVCYNISPMAMSDITISEIIFGILTPMLYKSSVILTPMLYKLEALRMNCVQVQVKSSRPGDLPKPVAMSLLFFFFVFYLFILFSSWISFASEILYHVLTSLRPYWKTVIFTELLTELSLFKEFFSSYLYHAQRTREGRAQTHMKRIYNHNKSMRHISTKLTRTIF